MRRKKIFVLVGHPDHDRLTHLLAEHYGKGAQSAGHEVRRLDLAALQFDPILHRGYDEVQELEPDLERVQEFIRWCDHFVLFYPAWWSTMPALLKGMFDRMWLPNFAFKFSKSGFFWRRLLRGRTARVFVLSDSPALLARVLFGDSTNEIRLGILWFAGIRAKVKKIGSLKRVGPRRIERIRRRFRRFGARAY